MIPPPAQRQMAKRAGATVVETQGQSCDLCFAATSRDQADRAGSEGYRMI
jgi:hypothetical protein